MGISKLKSETLRTTAFGSIGAAYIAVGTAFAHPISKLYIVNDTDAGVYFSDDGVNNKYYLMDGSSLLIDVTVEAINPDYIEKGTIFYVKQGPAGAPGSGLVTISALYGDNK